VSLLLQVLLPLASYCQQGLQLPAADWKTVPARYHITGVMDDRKQRQQAGEIVRGTVRQPIHFKGSLEQELYRYVLTGLEQDTDHTAGLELHVDRFYLKDLDNSHKHTITLDVKYRIVRPIEGTLQTLFELENRPTISLIGPETRDNYIRLVTRTLTDFVHQFDEWAKQHPDQPWFMNHTAVRFNTDEGKYRNSKDTILWSESYRLDWTDFKGKAPSPSPYSAQSNCVYGLLSIPSFSADTLYLTEVLHPCFTRAASWVEKDSKQDSLLLHEQLHFDLCELYGRKFRKTVSETKLSILQYDREINGIFKEVWDEYRSTQERYDEQTQHGVIREQQARWIERVAAELRDLEAFRTDVEH